jgi:hypothetical protein
MNYREINHDDLWSAIEHLGNIPIANLEFQGEEDLDPRDLLLGLGLSAPRKQKKPLEFLKKEDDYNWEDLMNASVPPVVVVDGVLADGFHRCRVCCVLGIPVKAAIYLVKRL